MAETANRVIKNTGYLYLKMAITVFISLYTTRLILNSLGASDFGIYNIVGGAISMLGFLNSTMAWTTQRFINYSEGEGNSEKTKAIFNVSLVLHFIIALSTGLILLISAFILFNGVLNIPVSRTFAAEVVYGSLVISTMFTVMTAPYDAVMNAHENMKYYSLIGIAESILKLLVAFACVWTSHDKLIVYGILMACIPLITLTVMRIYCHKYYKECVISPKRYWDKEVFKEIASFAGWNFMGSTTSLFGNYGLGVVLNHFFGSLLNAAQGIANQLNGMLMAFSNNMLKALNPVITKQEGAGNHKQVIKNSLTGSKFSFLLLAVFAYPCIIEMPFVLKIWLKNVPEWAVIFAILQLIRTLIEQLTMVLGTAIGAEGHIATYNKINSILNLMPIVFASILFAAGFSPVFMYVLNIIVFGILKDISAIVVMHKNCKMPYMQFIKELLLPVIKMTVIVLLISCIPLCLMQDGWIRLFVICILSTLSMAIVSWRITFNDNERKILKDVFIKYSSKLHKAK